MVPLSDVLPIPWRNGGGITRELIARPDPKNWVWRISVAEVASDGAFSSFYGVQRWLSILTGVGVRLHIGSEDIERIELGAYSDPLAFDGATPVHCILLGGPVQDLNLMLRADGHLGQMRRISGVERTVITDAKIIAIYSVNSPTVLWLNGERIEIPASALAWQALLAGAELIVEASNVVLMEVTQAG